MYCIVAKSFNKNVSNIVLLIYFMYKFTCDAFKTVFLYLKINKDLASSYLIYILLKFFSKILPNVNAHVIKLKQRFFSLS